MREYTLIVLEYGVTENKEQEEIVIKSDDEWEVVKEASRIAEERGVEVVIYQGETYIGVV